MASGIYIIKNLRNGKIYIGSASNIKKRWEHHKEVLRNGKHENSHLQHSHNKYGKEAFKFKILFECSKESLILREQEIIDLYKEEIGWDMMYNISPTAGSCLGIKRSQENKDKISASLRGQKASLKTRKKMSITRKGKKLRPRSPEHRAKQSKAHKGQIPWNKGKKDQTWTSLRRKAHKERSPEACAKTKAKMRESQRRRREREQEENND